MSNLTFINTSVKSAGSPGVLPIRQGGFLAATILETDLLLRQLALHASLRRRLFP
jgi:hypothetical protein